MSETKEIGSIKNIYFGLGGYQDCQIGYWVYLGGKSWGVNSGEGVWASNAEPTAKWTNESRNAELGAIGMKVVALLHECNVQDISKLIGKPIEATFEDFKLKSWRILTEAL